MADAADAAVGGEHQRTCRAAVVDGGTGFVVEHYDSPVTCGVDRVDIRCNDTVVDISVVVYGILCRTAVVEADACDLCCRRCCHRQGEATLDVAVVLIADT